MITTYSIHFNSNDKILITKNGVEINVYQYNKFYAYEDIDKSISIFKRGQEKSVARIDVIKSNNTELASYDVIIMLWNKQVPKKLINEIIISLKEKYEIVDVYYEDKCFQKIDELRL